MKEKEKTQRVEELKKRQADMTQSKTTTIERKTYESKINGWTKEAVIWVTEIAEQIARERPNDAPSIFITGGVVRDLILKKSCHDVDLVVENCDPIIFSTIFARACHSNSCKTHEQFKTSTVTIVFSSLLQHMIQRQIVDFQTIFSSRSDRLQNVNRLLEEGNWMMEFPPEARDMLDAFHSSDSDNLLAFLTDSIINLARSNFQRLFEGDVDRYTVKMDICGARLEHSERPAQLPIVELSSIRQDLFRRDITINSMAIQVFGSNSSRPWKWGDILDLYCGHSDLFDRLIRVLHPLSFVDDPSRVFRCIRFASRFDFTIGSFLLL